MRAVLAALKQSKTGRQVKERERVRERERERERGREGVVRSVKGAAAVGRNAGTWG
jgi:hypothetical protein